MADVTPSTFDVVKPLPFFILTARATELSGVEFDLFIYELKFNLFVKLDLLVKFNLFIYSFDLYHIIILSTYRLFVC
jgi:hypothetical protein